MVLVKKLAPLSDLVRSLVLVTTGRLDDDERQQPVYMYRIESQSFPVTDPKTYKSERVKLVQNDDIFYSVIVSMGAMGIIYSAVIEVKKKYYLDERRVLLKWADVNDQFVNDQIYQFRHVEIYLNPYKIDNKDHSVILTTRRESAEPIYSKPQSGRCFLAVAGKIIKDRLGGIFKFINFDEYPKFIETGLAQITGTYQDVSYKVFFLGDTAGKLGYAPEFTIDITESYKPLWLAIDALYAFAEEEKKS